MSLTAVLARAGYGIVGFLAAFGVAWGVDGLVTGGDVARNVSVGGVAVGGLSDAGARDAVEAMAAELAGTAIEIRTPNGSVTSTAGELGLTVDVDATVADLDEVGRDEPLASRPFAWLGSFVTERDADVVFTVDRAVFDPAFAALTNPLELAPVDPTFVNDGGTFTIVAGIDGAEVDPEAVLAALPAAAEGGGDPLVVDTGLVAVPPARSIDDVNALAHTAEERSSAGLVVQVRDQTTTIPPETVATWWEPVESAGTLTLGLVEERVQQDLETLLEPLGTGGGAASFTVVDGVVQIVPIEPGERCCDPTAAVAVEGALLGGAAQPVVLPLVAASPDGGVAEAEALGIHEVIGEFTTNHRGGESRVTNIHRIADLMRGVVIRPGETFSINDFIGPRTRENGFVPAGVIQNGVFEEGIGGGISQFATTMFNAAFYAGMDLVEYQSHSLYISRYPYGREATLSFPAPDLVVRNDSPYGILVWPSYTDTSITVQLYSTRWATVTELPQSEEPSGLCTIVRTPRQRDYPDGTSETDVIVARYRPGEGLDCNGNSTGPPETQPPVTTTVPPDTTPTTAPPPTETTAPTTPPTEPPPSTPPSTPPASGG
jgi:vancomycin resistance protein YoaR